MLTTGHMFLTAFHIELIQAQPIMAEGKENPPAGAIIAHPSLYDQHSHLQEAINNRSIWIITVSKHPNVPHLGNQQLRFFIQGYEVDRILLQLSTQLSEDMNNNPLTACQGDRPVVTRSTKPSFLYWEEYVTLLGYSLIYKHEHVEGLVKGLADAIATLKVVKIPQAGSRQYIGFLKLPNEFSLDLQPGDAIKLNFNAITILLTQPWDKDKQEWVHFNDDLEPSVIAINALGLVQDTRSWLRA
ncbi:hypothetical protein IFM5058_11042 [Aspergillus udagawae]|nr:hypothetical protein IFM5058_11042 [Aspergillus udagawae]